MVRLPDPFPDSHVPATNETRTVLLNNHTSVWGSWYDLASGIWGFACCHLTSKSKTVRTKDRTSQLTSSCYDQPVPGSYCTGKAGIAANEENTIHKMLESAGAREEQRKLDSERAQQKSLAEQHLENVAAGKGKGPADPEVKQNFSKGRLGEGDEIALDKERLKAAIAAEKKRKGVTDEDEAWNQAKRSKTDVTEEDMGKSTSVILIKRITVLTSFHEQRPTDLPVQRPSTIPWPITRTTSYSDRGSSIFLTSYPFHETYLYQHKSLYSIQTYQCTVRTRSTPG